MDKVNQDEQNTVDGILRKIEAKADTGEYLYRVVNRNAMRKTLTLVRFHQTSIAFSLQAMNLMLKQNILI